MSPQEKEVLKTVVERGGLFSPADLINAIANHDRRIVENLVVRGFLEEVPQDMGGNGLDYTLNFYRATEKGIMQFAPWVQWTFFNFKTNTAVWVGASSMVLGVAGLIFSTMTYFNAAHVNEIVNRPYIEISTPQFIFLDKDGRKFEEGTFPKVDDVKYFKIRTVHTNEGNLPAERIGVKSTTMPVVLEVDKLDHVVIYRENITESDRMPIEQLGSIFDDQSEFAMRTEVKYRSIGSKKIYTAFVESRCAASLTNTAFSVNCVFDRKGTN